MMKVELEHLPKIKQQFHNAVELKQSCKILVTTINEESWSFYFKKGCLIWASNSVHRFRRLYRLTNQICPEVNCQYTKLREQEISELWEYLLVAVLYKRKQISMIQVTQIIQELIKEVLFDCLLGSERVKGSKVIFETQGNGMGAILRSSLFKQPIAQIDYKKTIDRLEAIVSQSRNSAPKIYSLNLAPVIKDINKLRQNVDPATYQKLFIHINGKKTLRDLAITSRENMLEIARLFAPHIKSRAIILQQLPDQELTNLYFTPPNSKYEGQPNREYIQELDLPLVIFVDDNLHICQQAAQILNPLGYRLIAVNDAAKTLVVLLENKPSIIFLDAIMPDANGYELCAQIRNMPMGKNIPIIIAREQENMMDLVRAKMAGVSDFINKPIQARELETLAQKHTQSFVNYSLS